MNQKMKMQGKEKMRDEIMIKEEFQALMCKLEELEMQKTCLQQQIKEMNFKFKKIASL